MITKIIYFLHVYHPFVRYWNHRKLLLYLASGLWHLQSYFPCNINTCKYYKYMCYIYMLLLWWIWIRFCGFAIFILIISSHWCSLKILSGYTAELTSNVLHVCTMKGFEKQRMTLTEYVVWIWEGTLMLAKVGYTIYFDWLPIFLVLCGLSQNFSGFE